MKTRTLALLILFLGIGITSFSSPKRIKGSGNIIKETRDIKNFHSIDIGGAFEIELIKSDIEKIIIEADDNIMPYIKARVSGGELDVYTDVDIQNLTELKVSIYYRNIDELDISGAAELYSSDVLEATKLEFEFSGAAEVTLKIKADRLEADMSGASKVELEGSISNAELDSSGAAAVRAYGLEINRLDLEASGASVVKVLVIDHITVDISGASSVRYKGSPTLDIDDISGASSFRKG